MGRIGLLHGGVGDERLASQLGEAQRRPHRERMAGGEGDEAGLVSEHLHLDLGRHLPRQQPGEGDVDRAGGELVEAAEAQLAQGDVC
jgi:hypothetical protein